MLSKRILNSHVHYMKLMFTTKLKPAVSLCQIKGFAYNEKPSLKREKNDPNILSSSSANSLILMDLDKFDFSDKSLNGADTITVLSKLVRLYKEKALSPTKVVNKDFFNNLCALINSQVDNLTLLETLQCLEFLSELKVDLSSGYILNLLDRLYAFSSTASLHDCSDIMEVVEKFPSFPSTQQIEKCLRDKVADKMRTDFDQNDFEFLVLIFRFIYLYMNRQKNIMTKIVNALESHNFDTQSPQSVVSCLEVINSLIFYSRDCDEIVKKIYNALIKNMSDIQNKDILLLIEKSAVRIKDHRLQQFYNETLIDKVIQKLVSTKCSLDEGSACLGALIDIRHVNVELLNYLSDKIHQKMGMNRKYMKFHTYFLLLKGFAHFNCKPNCWEPFLNSYKTHRILNYEIKEILYTAFHLACLDHYEPKLLEVIFESQFQFEKNTHMHFILLKLYQKLKTTPNYNGPLPSEKLVKSFELLMIDKTTQQKSDCTLYADLTKTLGGPEYVKTNVPSKLYHQIDYVAAFSPEGNPVAFNDIKKGEDIKNSAGSVEYLENLNIPQDCQVVAIINVPKNWYTRNTDEILGTHAIQIETLEALQCKVVPIKIWESKSLKSSPAFLMDCIRNKLKIKKRRG